MKNLLTLCIIAILGFSLGCSSKKQISAKDEGFSNYEEPLTKKQFQTDKSFIRARGIGESPDISFSEKLGEQDARSKIAAQIEQVVNEYLRTYSEQYKNQLGIDYSSKSEGITRTVTNQTLAGTRIVDFQKQKNKSGLYRYFVVMEIPKGQVKDAMKDQLRSSVTDQERSRLDQKMKAIEQDMDNFLEKKRDGQI